MTLPDAIRLIELLLGLSLLQQSLEHLAIRRSLFLHGAHLHAVFAIRVALSVCLVAHVLPGVALFGLLLTAIFLLDRFGGPFNGGADKMGLLILSMLCIAHLWPSLAEIAIGYLAIQLTLSYAVSGWVKLVNPDWRRGQALVDVFRLSSYPVSSSLRRLAAFKRTLRMASWGVIVFELAFPVLLFSGPIFYAALGLAALFHTANAVLFGFNRFVWTWIAAFPSIIWLHSRIGGPLMIGISP